MSNFSGPLDLPGEMISVINKVLERFSQKNKLTFEFRAYYNPVWYVSLKENEIIKRMLQVAVFETKEGTFLTFIPRVTQLENNEKGSVVDPNLIVKQNYHELAALILYKNQVAKASNKIRKHLKTAWKNAISIKAPSADS